MNEFNSINEKKLAIIADDLTGAVDSTGRLAALGLNTVVILDKGFSSEADVIALTTNSRAENPETARRRLRQAADFSRGRIIYKKIDSTLRGNIGKELDVLMQEKGYDKTIVAPAFPEMGRTIENGMLLLDGIAVSRTHFADDPVFPVKKSHIPTILEKATSLPVGWVSLQDIEEGPENFSRIIDRMPHRIIVCDAKHPYHLEWIVKAAALSKGHWLLCGSTGLARETHLLLGDIPYTVEKMSSPKLKGPVLAVVGSRNKVTTDQLQRAKETIDLPILDVDVGRIVREGNISCEVERILEKSEHLFKKKKRLVLSSTFTPYFSSVKQTLPVMMAEITAQLLDFKRFNNLFLSGGDTAIEVCRRLKVSAISVHGEIEPGISVGEMLGDRIGRIKVITKAGGFGSEEALVKSINYLEKGGLR